MRLPSAKIRVVSVVTSAEKGMARISRDPIPLTIPPPVPAPTWAKAGEARRTNMQTEARRIIVAIMRSLLREAANILLRERENAQPRAWPSASANRVDGAAHLIGVHVATQLQWSESSERQHGRFHVARSALSQLSP